MPDTNGWIDGDEETRAMAVLPTKAASPRKLSPRPQRRRFSTAAKLRILDEIDRAADPASIGAILRREGLTFSVLADWRRQRNAGAFDQAKPHRGEARGAEPLRLRFGGRRSGDRPDWRSSPFHPDKLLDLDDSSEATIDIRARPTPADMEAGGLIVEVDGRSQRGDEFRIVAGRLQGIVTASIADNERCGNLVLVTSTRSGEGKSFCALNIAASLAGAGARSVVLVDVDDKVGCLSEVLGLTGFPGILNLIGDRSVRPEMLVVPTPVPGLFILPIGNAVWPNASGPRNQSLPSVAEHLSRRFAGSTVIMDTGPLLATSDPSVLAPTAAQIVMVVEAGRTSRGQLEAAMHMVKACPKVMMLLNKQAERGLSTFGASGGRAYTKRPSRHIDRHDSEAPGGTEPAADAIRPRPLLGGRKADEERGYRSAALAIADSPRRTTEHDEG